MLRGSPGDRGRSHRVAGRPIDGRAAHLLNQTDEARHALEAALRLEPQLHEAAVLLGELAYRAGDLPRAIRTYEDALALSPQHDHMCDTLARWRREAALHGRFAQQISHDFTIRFEGQAERPLAERALAILEVAY